MPLSRHKFIALAVTVILSVLAFSGFPAEVFAQIDRRAITGEWSAPVAWPFISIHATLLPNGKVLGWGRGKNGDQDATPDEDLREIGVL